MIIITITSCCKELSDHTVNRPVFWPARKHCSHATSTKPGYEMWWICFTSLYLASSWSLSVCSVDTCDDAARFLFTVRTEINSTGNVKTVNRLLLANLPANKKPTYYCIPPYFDQYKKRKLNGNTEVFFTLFTAAPLCILLLEFTSLYNLRFCNIIAIVITIHKHAGPVFSRPNSQVANTMNLISNATSIIWFGHVWKDPFQHISTSIEM